MLHVICTALFVGLAVSQSNSPWQQVGRYFEVFLDLGVNSETAAYASAIANGIGSMFLKGTNGFQNWTSVAERDDFMGLGCGSTGASNAVVTGALGKGEYTLNGGNTWGTTLGLVVACQNVVHGLQDGMLGAASGEGLAISTDHGVTFTHHRGPEAMNSTRYGAVPTETTWYVTTGSWNEATQSPEMVGTNTYTLSSKFKLHHNTKSNEFKWDLTFANPQNTYKKRKMLQAGTEMWGQIWKTTDGGSSWKMVYNNVGEFYFNAIDCCDANTCYAVAEGDSTAGSSNPGARIFKTADGGETWNMTYFDQLDGSSMMAVHCLTPNQAFAAGGTIIQGDFGGHFYGTTDGGQSWTDYGKTDAPVLFMDMSNDGKVGVASGMTRDSEGAVYVYDKAVAEQIKQEH